MEGVLARVGTNVITVESFQGEILRREQTTGKRFRSAEEMESLLEEMVRFETLFARAQDAGYDRNPEMQQRFRRMIVAKYQEDRLPERDKEPMPKEADIAAFYQGHREEFLQPAKVRAVVLFQRVSSKATAEKQAEAMKRMESWREQALSERTRQPTFGDLARQHSDHAATRYQGGDCGWVSRSETDAAWPRPVVDAMFSLAQPGDISSVVRAAEGLYLVKLVEARAPEALPLERVRERIAWQLRAQSAEMRQQDFYDHQKAGVNIVVNREALARLVAQAKTAAPELAGPPPVPRR